MKPRVFFVAGALCVLSGCGDEGTMTAPRFDDLPENVQAKLESETGGGEITRIEKEQDGSRAVYHVSFKEAGTPAKISVTEHGMVISDSRNRVIHEPAGAPLAFGNVAARARFNALPPAVQKTVGARTSNKLEIKKVRTSERGGRTLYEIEFDSPGQNPRMYVVEDGTLIEDQRDAFRQ